jgi:hypothetical protein
MMPKTPKFAGLDRPPMTDKAWLSAFHAAWLEVDQLGRPV